VGLLRLLRDPLHVRDGRVVLLGFFSDPGVLLHSIYKPFPTFRRLDMFNPDMDSLGDDPLSDPLVDDDTNSMRSDIEDPSSPSMIELERHSLLECSVSDDVYEVSSFVGSEVGSQRFHSILLESTGEHVPGSPTVSLGVGHVDG